MAVSKLTPDKARMGLCVRPQNEKSRRRAGLPEDIENSRSDGGIRPVIKGERHLIGPQPAGSTRGAPG